MEIQKVNVPNSLMASTRELSNCKLAEMRIFTPLGSQHRVVHTSNLNSQEARAKQAWGGLKRKENRLA